MTGLLAAAMERDHEVARRLNAAMDEAMKAIMSGPPRPPLIHMQHRTVAELRALGRM